MEHAPRRGTSRNGEVYETCAVAVRWSRPLLLGGGRGGKLLLGGGRGGRGARGERLFLR